MKDLFLELALVFRVLRRDSRARGPLKGDFKWLFPNLLAYKVSV